MRISKDKRRVGLVLLIVFLIVLFFGGKKRNEEYLSTVYDDDGNASGDDNGYYNEDCVDCKEKNVSSRVRLPRSLTGGYSTRSALSVNGFDDGKPSAFKTLHPFKSSIQTSPSVKSDNKIIPNVVNKDKFSKKKSAVVEPVKEKNNVSDSSVVEPVKEKNNVSKVTFSSSSNFDYDFTFSDEWLKKVGDESILDGGYLDDTYGSDLDVHFSMYLTIHLLYDLNQKLRSVHAWFVEDGIRVEYNNGKITVFNGTDSSIKVSFPILEFRRLEKGESVTFDFCNEFLIYAKFGVLEVFGLARYYSDYD